MAIIITISRILSLLVPIVWVVLMFIYRRNGRFYNLVTLLTCILVIWGVVSGLSAGLGLFGLE